MKRLFLLGAFAVAAIVVGGLFALREVAQSFNTVGTSPPMSGPMSPQVVPPPDQDPSFSVATGGPSALYPADIFNIGPGLSIPCLALGLGCPGAVPFDDIDALSYGGDFTWTMKPYWKWLFFSVEPGASGLAGSAVAGEAACPTGAEPEADEFWSSAHPQLNTNGLYYDGDGIDCNTGVGIPGLGLIETPTSSDNLDALDEFPSTTGWVYYSLTAASPSVPAGATGGAVLVSMPGAVPPKVYASAAQLGLQAMDELDALCLLDQDDYYSTTEPLWFSLRTGSPTLVAIGAQPGDVLAPNPAGGPPVVVVQESALGLTPTDDLNALKCAEIGLEADKAVTDIVFDDATGYPYDGSPLPLHPTKDLPYVAVSSDDQMVISVTSVEENLGPGEPNDALVAFYADIPPGCEGRWYDAGAPTGLPDFPSDFYTVGGDPRAAPFSPAQLGDEDLDPFTKKPGDDDADPQPDTFEVDLHFQTLDYQITEPVTEPPTQVPITRFFDLGCTTPGQYHFWFCNKIEPKDLIDPDLTNNVWCEEMVVESLEPTPTPTPSNTPTPSPTPTPTEVPEPHYECYYAPGLDPQTAVDLETQFGIETGVDVSMGGYLCPPTIKHDAQGDHGTLDASHLRCFFIDEPAPGQVVNLTTQFGSYQNVVVEGAVELCLPVSKQVIDPVPQPPTPLEPEPHYKCYGISGPDLVPANEQVIIETQFHPAGEPVTVGAPGVLCLPAGKNGAPIPDAPHLVCYEAPTSPLSPPWVVSLITQFFGEIGFVEDAVPVYDGEVLCVPAEKEVVTCIDRLGDTQCDDPVNDPDDDGCVDSEEQAGAPPPKPGATGTFDPTAWYDFYDVPVPAKPDAGPGSGANGIRNKAIDISDVLAVLFYSGANNDGPPNGNGVDYDTIKGVDMDGDTDNDILPPLHAIEEGLKYDRSPSAAPNPPWEAGPPNGVIDISDVLGVLAQSGLDCSGAP
jgi:hypothetical protein